MTKVDRNIINTYYKLLKGLSNSNKAELIKKLNSFDIEHKEKQLDNFIKLFGSWDFEYNENLKSFRKFKNKQISF